MGVGECILGLSSSGGRSQEGLCVTRSVPSDKAGLSSGSWEDSGSVGVKGCVAQTWKAAGILVFRSVDIYPRVWTMICKGERYLCVERPAVCQTPC